MLVVCPLYSVFTAYEVAADRVVFVETVADVDRVSLGTVRSPICHLQPPSAFDALKMPLLN